MSKTLEQWCLWIKSLHIQLIDLGLDRVTKVAKNMNLLNPLFPVITVAGTNGKGSTVAGLEAIYTQAGYKTGAFSSPFLFCFNEQIRLSGINVDDKTLCEAFEKVDAARKDITLTPFEFTTLAALIIFQEANLDVVILEVGLGGRLDAVNVMDADIAIVTSIDIDHADWLGDTREKIAIEKAGIFRSGKPAIVGDLNPPQTLIDVAKKIGATLYCQNNEFGYETDGFSWNWWSQKNCLKELPQTQLLLQNMSGVLMAVELLQSRLPVKRADMDAALQNVKLRGRIQVVDGDVQHIYDVSHNPAAVTVLTNYLNKHPISGKNMGVFSMLADKDITQTLSIIKNNIDEWYVAPLTCDRAATQADLEKRFANAKINNPFWFTSIKAASAAAEKSAHAGDRIIVFGSFHTVAEVLST